ncbi:hypothetical protein BV22DRAFT_469577 [Leucogyrophana mollusca]|uniref:Uncharacterized protein n=1 Tax=Leucogyrophana mollusca TaxID=85980 RepID=A0ACB8BGJ2_9AGAM|nr:hypothetical protein BV22DRAFT_469577 [Leucogyrophana mollusca]
MSLPPEIILAILEPEYYTVLGSPNYSLLSTCALVCSTWSGPAQSLLFRNVKKLRASNTPIFNVAIDPSTPRGRMLGSCVRTLDIHVGRSVNDSCSPQDFVRLLRGCPRLYELVLSTYGIHEFSEEALIELREGGGSLKALSLMYCGVQSPVIFQLLGVWPQIQFLKIGTEIVASPPRSFHLAGSSISVASGAPVQLYDLVLLRTPSPEVLAWLLASSTESLRIVELREMPGGAARNILANHTTRLRSLRLLHYSMDSAALLRECTELEEFMVYHVPTVVPLAPDLPQSIKHFGFRNPIYNYRDTLSPILEAVSRLPRLRTLTCDQNAVQLSDFSQLQSVCDDRGVEVVVSEVPFWVVGRFRLWDFIDCMVLMICTTQQFEDPVVARRFPRRRSVSNFGLMA